MKIALFGLPVAGLALLRDGHSLCLAAVPPIPAPGRRRLRSLVSQESWVDVRELRPADVAPRVVKALGACQPDLVVCWFWTRRLPPAWFECARHGGIGVHPSLLPRHRGPDPYYWTIDLGDREAGITVYQLTARYDEGHILGQASLPVQDRNAWQLARALDRVGLRGLRDTVCLLKSGESPPARPQDARLATWAPRPEGDQLRVSWRWSTARILRRIRALSPAPGLALEVEGVPLVVTAAERTCEVVQALRPGEAAIGPRLTVRTADGAIALTRAWSAADRDAGGEIELDATQIAEFVRGRC